MRIPKHGIHCGAKKLHHFTFAITFLSKRLTVKQLLTGIVYLEQNDIKSVNLS